MAGRSILKNAKAPLHLLRVSASPVSRGAAEALPMALNGRRTTLRRGFGSHHHRLLSSSAPFRVHARRFSDGTVDGDNGDGDEDDDKDNGKDKYEDEEDAGDDGEDEDEEVDNDFNEDGETT